MKKIFSKLPPVLALALVSPLQALALTPEERCKQLADQFGGLFNWALSDPAYCTLNGLIAKVMSLALSFAGVVAVFVIILGGYRYLTAGGNQEQADKGRKTLTNGVIGLIVILLAGAMVRIATNFIVSGNGSGGTTGQSSGLNPPANGTANTQTIQAAISVLSQRASVQGANVVASLYVPSADAAKINAMCGTNDPSAAAVAASVLEGTVRRYLGDANFQPSQGGWMANIIASSNKLHQGSNVIEFTLCGTRVPPSSEATITLP